MRSTFRIVWWVALGACVVIAGYAILATVPRTSAAASSTWSWQNPLPHAYSMDAIACPTVDDCIAVGQRGSITTTSDGGRHWTSRASGTTTDLVAISCPTLSICYITGSVLTPAIRNVVLKSVDGGKAWFQPSPRLSIPTDQVVESLVCASPMVCFMTTAIVESTTTFIRRSTDGGRTWRDVTGSIPGMGPLCLTNGVCFAWSGHIVFRSEDAGAAWKRWSRVPGNDPHLALVCPEAKTCLAVSLPSQPRGSGPDDVFLTRDDGKTWRRVTRVGPIVSWVCGSATTCYLFEPSNVIETTNGGETWRSYPVSLPDSPFQPVCPGPTTCYAAGGYTTLMTSDGFRHIQQTPASNSISGVHLFSISCPSTTTCYASSYYPSSPGVVATSDGGRTWITIPGKAPDHVICPSVTVCYSFGSPDAPPSQAAYPFRSGDGARSWRQLTIPMRPSRGATCVDERTCYVLATRSSGLTSSLALLVTKDGGATWRTKMSIKRAAGLSAFPLYPRPLSCPSVSTCFVGAGRWSGRQFSLKVFRTTDAGNSWSASAPVPSPACTTRCVNALDCPTATTCYMVPLGNNGGRLPTPIVSIVTHDAGATWQKANVTPAISSFLRDISCAGAQDCRVIGLDGIYGTSDGGSTWQKQTVQGGTRSFPDLQGIACPAAGTCYAVGDEAILATHPPRD